MGEIKNEDPKKCVGAEIIEKILKEKNLKKVHLAQLLGKDSAGLTSWMKKNMTFDEVVSIANYYGYDVTIHPSGSDKGVLGFQTESICNSCKYKNFSDTVEGALDNLKARANEVGKVVDFYLDYDKETAPTNKETELKSEKRH